jgi:hypothetical protein
VWKLDPGHTYDEHLVLAFKSGVTCGRVWGPGKWLAHRHRTQNTAALHPGRLWARCQPGNGRVKLSRLPHGGLPIGGKKTRGKIWWLRAPSYPSTRQWGSRCSSPARVKPWIASSGHVHARSVQALYLTQGGHPDTCARESASRPLVGFGVWMTKQLKS